MRWVLWLGQVLVALAVAALTANTFRGLHGLTVMAVPEWWFRLVGLLVLIGPVVWLLWYVVQAMAMSAAAGSGVWDGCKMGCTLGLALGFTKLWMPLLGFALGAWLGGGPLWMVVVAVVVGGVLLTINRVVKYFWHKTSYV